MMDVEVGREYREVVEVEPTQTHARMEDLDKDRVADRVVAKTGDIVY